MNATSKFIGSSGLQHRAYEIERTTHSIYVLLDRLMLSEGQDAPPNQQAERVKIRAHTLLSESAARLSLANAILRSLLPSVVPPSLNDTPFMEDGADARKPSR